MSLTDYPSVNSAMISMSDGISELLGDNFIGFYIYGSLATGGFDPQSSDIDAIVLTSRDIDEDEFNRLKIFHENLVKNSSHWIKETELYYMPLEAIKKYDRKHPPRVRFHAGKLARVWQGDDWILHRHVLRETGIVVTGPKLSKIINPVSAMELRTAVGEGILQNWWKNKVLVDTARLRQDRYQAHAVLTMCRALFTLKTGKLSSKRNSALWAKGNIDASFGNFIDQALRWKPGEIMDRYDDTVEFIEYAVMNSKTA